MASRTNIKVKARQREDSMPGVHCCGLQKQPGLTQFETVYKRTRTQTLPHKSQRHIWHHWQHKLKQQFILSDVCTPCSVALIMRITLRIPWPLPQDYLILKADSALPCAVVEPSDQYLYLQCFSSCSLTRFPLNKYWGGAAMCKTLFCEPEESTESVLLFK